MVVPRTRELPNESWCDESQRTREPPAHRCLTPVERTDRLINRRQHAGRDGPQPALVEQSWGTVEGT